MSNRIHIKKYPNRRLYDTERSIYITQEDVADLIKKGYRIEVTDVKTGEDITAIILTQIIMNKARENNSLLPVSMLHLVIQYGENLLHEFFDKYLEKTIENYLDYRKRMDDQFNAYLEMGMGFTNFAEKAFREISPVNFFSSGREQFEDENTKNSDKKDKSGDS